MSCLPFLAAGIPSRLLKLSVTKRLVDVRRKDLEKFEWDLNTRPPPLASLSPLTAVPDSFHNSPLNHVRTVRVA